MKNNSPGSGAQVFEADGLGIMALYKGAFMFAPDAVIAVDNRGEILMVNQQCLAIFGYSSEELIGKPIEILIPMNLHEKHRVHVSQYAAHPRVRPMGARLDLSARRKDGSHFPVDITLGPLKTDNGVIILANVRDITDRKKDEAELKLYKNHLEELVEKRTEELNQEIARRRQAEADLAYHAAMLERSNRDLADFASIISHDLNEPLRKIYVFGQRLMNGEESISPTGLEDLGRVLSAATRMQTMISDLLTYSRVSTRYGEYQKVKLNELIKVVLSTLELRITETGGSVHVDELPEIEAEPLQMELLFQNLIGNALKYHKPEVPPQIHIFARRSISPSSPGKSQTVDIMVKDNGIGIEEQYLEKIFQPFQRLHGRGKYEGSGMGLAICKKIVERHGWTIKAKSKPDEGTTFIITLPI